MTDEVPNSETKEELEPPLSPSLYPLPNIDLETPKEVPVMENEENGNNIEEGPMPKSPDFGGNSSSDYCHQECVKMDLDIEASMTVAPPACGIEKLKKRFVKRTKGYGVSDLEKLHATICQEVRSHGDVENKMSAFRVLEQTVAGMKVKKNSVSQEGMTL